MTGRRAERQLVHGEVGKTVELARSNLRHIRDPEADRQTAATTVVGEDRRPARTVA
jgi:hypothetical protein